MKMAGGATPDVKEEERFYTKESDGIPFIRVQNLSEPSELVLDDLKYINKETHQVMLKRSQIKEDDLLVKITGVGRMAVSSVVPKNFVGNINQHLVVIKTKEQSTSEHLAFYLNTDVCEKLASRRSTGGTRPALDYPALRSIPIIFNPRISATMKKAYAEKKAKEAEAEKLLASVDGLVLDALGITLPDAEENTLDKRIFFTNSKEISNGRFDPHYVSPKFDTLKKLLKAKNIEFVKLLSASKKIFSGITPLSGGESYTTKELGIPFVRSGDYSIQNEIDFDELIYLEPEIHFKLMKGSKLQKGDLLIAIVGATIGKVGVFNYDVEANINQAICGIRLRKEFNPFFVQAFLLSSIGQMILDRIKRPVARANINLEEISEILIPNIAPNKQAEIAARVAAIYAEAKGLREEGAEILRRAKAEVEKMILGED